MAQITLRFSHEINTSAQIGDVLYFTPTTTVGATNFKEGGTIFEIGPIVSITRGGESYKQRVDVSTAGASTFLGIQNSNIVEGMDVSGVGMSPSAQTFNINYPSVLFTPPPTSTNNNVNLTFSLPINTSIIKCELSPSPNLPDPGDFIMFSKDNAINMTSVLGYYAKVEFKNDSTDEAELFSIGSEIFESSK